MDARSRLREISEFLAPFETLFQNEIMLSYPEPLRGYPATWVKEIAEVTKKDDLIRLEKKDVSGILRSPHLLAFYQKIEALSFCPKMKDIEAMPETAWTFLYTIPKKQHEIRKLAPLINSYYKDFGIEHIIDIGGGVGLLAQNLSNVFDLKVTTLDLNQEFQKTGSERQKNNFRAKNNLQYVNLKVAASDLEFQKLLSRKTLTVGLHTCGELANEQIVASAKQQVKSVINLGCCYQKLTHPTSQNLSQFSQTLPHKLELRLFALVLAARAHRKMDEKDLDFKIKVKKFRYAIHILLNDRYGHTTLANLGNSHASLYDQDFATYALEQFARLQMKPLQSRDELNRFFADAHLQKTIWEMLAAGFIRNALGRLLELYLLLDRVIYLQEQGYETQLLEMFNEELSPRNLGIVAVLV